MKRHTPLQAAFSLQAQSRHLRVYVQIGLSERRKSWALPIWSVAVETYDLRRSAKPRGGDHERGPRQHEELKTYLAFGEDAMSALKQFDETYIASAKDGWIDTFQRTVNVQ